MAAKSSKTAKIMALAAIIAFTGSCTKELMDLDALMCAGVKRDINCEAGLPATNHYDKAFLDPTDRRKVKWENGDALNINGTSITLSRVISDTTAIFNGTTYAIPSGDNEVYWAVYPTSIAGTYTKGIPASFTADSLMVSFPPVQSFSTQSKVLAEQTFMAAYASVPSGTSDLSLQMRNLGAILKLRLTPSISASTTIINKIVLSVTNGKLSGDFSVSNDASDPTINSTAMSAKSLTVNLSNGSDNYIDIKGGVEVFVFIPPIASCDLTVKIYGENGNYCHRSISSATFLRNNIYTGNLIDLDFEQSEPYFTANSNGDRVGFAPGNLQYKASSGTWRFAERQYDIVGYSNENISSSYNGWIDLFGWGTSGHKNKYPYMKSISATDYGEGAADIKGTLYDWGLRNSIYNTTTGITDIAGTWRAFTKDEIYYICKVRNASTVNGADNARFAKATINHNGSSIAGLILLPDNYIHPDDIDLLSVNNSTAPFTDNEYTETQWQTLEKAGAVFLPCAGRRSGTLTSLVGTQGFYWATTHYDENYSNILEIRNSVNAQNNLVRYYGISVRLIKDIL